MEFLDLPVELLHEIALLASSSKGSYHSLREVSRLFRDLVTGPCLYVVPVILTEKRAVTAFSDFLESKPHLALRVHHIWFRTSHHSLINQILAKCVNLVSLGCLLHQLLELCLGSEFKHRHLKEVMLSGTSEFWYSLSAAPHGKLLCSQITHLRVLDGVYPAWPKVLHLFTSLTHFAFVSRLIKDYVKRHLVNVKAIPSLQRIVIISDWFRESEPEAEVWDMIKWTRDCPYSIAVSTGTRAQSIGSM